MVDMPFNDVQVKCFIGAPQTGRTFSLVQEAALRARKGASVLYVCARRGGVDGVQRAFADCEQVHVAACEEVALRVLATPEARSQYGREPRLLEPYEESILLEDLKVSQMKNRRLRKVLAYLRAGWSNLSDDAWEQTAEEDLIIDRMRANLRFTGGVLRCEASNFAVHVLRDCGDVRVRMAWDYVIVDDFELLSRASQHMVCLLARCGLAVSAGARPTLAGDDEYPCFDGLRELLEEFPQAKVSLLRDSCQAADVRRAMGGLRADDALKPLVDVAADAVIGSVSADYAADPSLSCSPVRVLPSVEEELRALAVAANEALQAGQSVLIVGVNRLWRRNVATNLKRVGLPVEQLQAGSVRVRDLRDERQCARARKDALSRLAANSQDGVAWRTLLALGDSVARSAAVDYLRQAVEGCLPDGRPVGICQALELLAAGKVPADELVKPLFNDLLAAYRRAQDALAAYREAETANGSAKVDGGAKAADRRLNPVQSGARPVVVVAAPDQVSGLRFDTVIFGGFVNGLIPCRAYCDPTGMAAESRAREHANDVRAVYGVASCARKQLLFTAFGACNLQVAETLDVHIESIKLRHGVRMAQTQQSELSNLVR